MKIKSSQSVVVQWDEVKNSFLTTYIVTWTSDRDHILHPVILIEQLSYTITGLTLDTVYTITVTASNRCGQGPEYRTTISLTTDITSTITPTIIASTNTITIVSTATPSTTSTIVSPTPTVNLTEPRDTTSKFIV